MDTYKCTHFRVKGCYDYNMDIEKFIKNLEDQFKIDFKTLPQWKELIEIINIIQSEYKVKLQRAGNRKIQILQNIFIQNSRLSPFELTEKLARTSKLWQENLVAEKRNFKDKVKDDFLFPSCLDVLVNQDLEGEGSHNESNIHPNTEEIQSKELLRIEPDIDQDFKSPSSPLLPVTICTNQHKIISPMGSNYTPLKSQEHGLVDYDFKSNSVIVEEDMNLASYDTKLVKFYPSKIIITNSSLKEQSFKLFVTNCCTEYIHIRFKKLSDSSYFKNFKVLPSTPTKLYPGLSVVLKFTYTLQSNHKGNDISSLLYFKVNRNVLFKTSDEIICIPIISKFVKSGNITVSETVCIPPAYCWQVSPKYGYPKAIVHVKNQDDEIYYLYIRKKVVDFSKEGNNSINSVEVISPETNSLIQKTDDNDIETQSKLLLTLNTKHNVTSTYIDQINAENESINNCDIVKLVINDIIDLALEPFIFKQTYLRILPRSTKLVLVYFTKVHHIGYHQNYYELIFYDTKSCDIVLTKTIKVFAEVLPHPIILQPTMLDMTKSPIRFGYWEDYFNVINSHTIFPVTIKIKTTAKMKKIFKIIPMETLVLPKSSANFKVQICLRNFKKEVESDYLAYFTIKIQAVGHKSVYSNVPPLFYEIIAPCATEFKQVYGKKCFNDVEGLSEIISSDLLSSCEHLYKHN